MGVRAKSELMFGRYRNQCSASAGISVRFEPEYTGATTMLRLPVPLSAFMARKTRPEIVEEVDRLLEQHHDTEIAEILNKRGIQTGNALPFTVVSVGRIRRTYELKDRKTRLREKGMLSRKEMLKLLQVSDPTLRAWKNRGLIKIHVYGNTIENILYEPPTKDFAAKIKNSKFSKCVENFLTLSNSNSQEV